MSKVRYFLHNVAFGIFFGFCVALSLAAFFDADVTPEVRANVASITTGVLSLLAAVLALLGVFATIDHQRELEAEARLRKLQAARAFLPSALSRVCAITNMAIYYSHEFERAQEELGELEFRDKSISDLSLTDEIISVFREVIELSEDKLVRNRLSGLLREHQVFLARWSGHFSPDQENFIWIASDTRQRTVAWGYLGAIAASLFDYARAETDTIETNVGETEISSALNAARVGSLHTENFQEEISLYARTFARRFLLPATTLKDND